MILLICLFTKLSIHADGAIYSTIDLILDMQCDYNEKMLAVGKKNIAQLGLQDRIKLVRGDAMDLKRGVRDQRFAAFDNHSFNTVLCVCGIGGIGQSP